MVLEDEFTLKINELNLEKVNIANEEEGEEPKYLYTTKVLKKIAKRELSKILGINNIVNPFAADISKIENIDPNESLVSINNNSSFIKFKMNNSLDQRSYLTNYDQK